MPYTKINSKCIKDKAEVGVFLQFSCFFDDPVDVGNLICGSSVFSKSSLNIWKFMVHVLLQPGLENFEHYFSSMWNECNCVVVWTFFSISFLWDWNENWTFPVLWPLLFSKFAGQSIVPCPVLTVASWPAYRFLKKQVRWSGRAVPKRGLGGVPGFISWEIPGNTGKRSLGEARIQKSPAVV